MPEQTFDPDRSPESSGKRFFLTAYVLYIRLWLSIARSADLTEQDAEDVVHSVLASILADGRREFESLEHARNYVAKSVLNRVREMKMKGSRRTPWEDLPEERLSVKADEYGLDERSRRDALRRVMQGLPRKDFNIIKLRFFSGLTLAEVGELLSIPISTISSRETVILARIRVLMRKMGYGGASDPY
jgi:RNA polymerase sigma factor (sigma-70 family)